MSGSFLFGSGSGPQNRTQNGQHIRGRDALPWASGVHVSEFILFLFREIYICFMFRNLGFHIILQMPYHLKWYNSISSSHVLLFINLGRRGKPRVCGAANSLSVEESQVRLGHRTDDVWENDTRENDNVLLIFTFWCSTCFYLLQFLFPWSRFHTYHSSLYTKKIQQRKSAADTELCPGHHMEFPTK